MNLTCNCDVEKNGFMDLEIKKKDKNKVLQVFRISKADETGRQEETLRFMLKF